MIDHELELKLRSESTHDLHQRQRAIDQALMAAKMHGVEAQDLEEQLNVIYCELAKRELADKQ
ncbi:MAG TPA: hypothetical protein V6C69_06070 [Trichormus sp.]|jgi:hypothetical protein